MSNIIADVINLIDYYLPKKEVETVIVKEIEKLKMPIGRNFVRIAGLSGSLAVIMSAYGAHVFSATEDERLKNVFESGNKMHLIHSAALMGVPMTNRPRLVGGLMVAGLVIFSGTCYYQALTGDGRIRKFTPYGGILLILSWLAMIL